MLTQSTNCLYLALECKQGDTGVKLGVVPLSLSRSVERDRKLNKPREKLASETESQIVQSAIYGSETVVTRVLNHRYFSLPWYSTRAFTLCTI